MRAHDARRKVGDKASAVAARLTVAMVAGAMLLACSGDDDSAAIASRAVEAPILARYSPGANGIFVDPGGREILLRGVNVNSLGDYWHFDDELPAVFPFEESDMDFLASMGLNLVRLVISWSLVEPEPGVYDEVYLDRVADTVARLWQRRIFTLVDLHQDAWGPSLPAREDEGCSESEKRASGWDGAPAWATLTDDATPRCIQPFAGLLLRELSPAVLEAWAGFWDNRLGPGGIGVQDRYTAMLRHLANRLGGVPGVMGYDIMNEPNAYPSELVDAVAPLFTDLLDEETIDVFRTSLDALAAFYVDAVDALRAGELDAGIEPRIIVFEPSALWPNVPSGSTVEPFSGDPQLAYGPHIYQAGISFLVDLDDEQVERVRQEAASYGGVPILTGEWGASPSTAGEAGGYYEEMIELQDREHWSTAHWLYQASCGDPHYDQIPPAEVDVWGYREVVCDGADANAVGPVRTALFDRIARPAVHYAPGPIDSISWDPENHSFTVSGSRAEADRELEAFFPGRRSLRIEAEGLGETNLRSEADGVRLTAAALGGAWSLHYSSR